MLSITIYIKFNICTKHVGFSQACYMIDMWVGLFVPLLVGLLVGLLVCL